MNSLSRGVSQPVPSAMVVVTFNSPFGFPFESASRICVEASLLNTSCAVR